MCYLCTRFVPISSPFVGAEDFLTQIVADFGLIGDDQRASERTSATSNLELVTRLHEFLMSLVPLDLRAVVLVDEAQHLDLSVLEQIRVLANLGTDTAKLLQILLVGHPELQSRLRRPDIQSLDQRVSCRSVLSPLTPDEVGPYIERRLEVAQRGTAVLAAHEQPPPTVKFTPAAVEVIADVSGGIPRAVNEVCACALEIGYEREVRSLDRQVAVAAARQVGLTVPSPSGPTRGRPIAMTMWVAGVTAVASTVWWQISAHRWPTEHEPSRPMAVTSANAPAAKETASTELAATESTATESTLPAADGVLLVVGTFESRERASAVAREIGARGLPAFARLDATGDSHVVLVGPYVSREEALEAQRQIAALHYPNQRIVSERR